MSDTAVVGALASLIQPVDSAALEPFAADDAAFHAVFSALGYQSLQTSAQLRGQHPASLGRSNGENGNIVPLHYLNGIPIAPTAVEQQAASLHSAIDDDVSNSDQSLLRTAGQELTIPGRNRFGLDIESRVGVPGEGIQLTPSPRLIPVPVSVVVDAVAAPMAPTTAPAAAVVDVAAPFPLHSPRFAEGFTQQVTLMASDGVQQARITLNPPALGPVELRITVRNDEASVHLASQHAAVREALAEALPRLREQFDQAGMQLADSRVFSELPGHSAQHEGRERDVDSGPALAELELAELTAGPAEITVQHGFVDAYV